MLQSLVSRLLNKLNEPIKDEHSLKSDFLEIINNIFNILIKDEFNKYGFTHIVDTSDEVINKLCDAYVTIYKITNNPVERFYSDGKVQNKKIYTIAEYLNKTLTDNFHTVVAPCNSLNKNGVCMNGLLFINGRNGYHKFVCDHHLHDSLSIHLVLTSLINGLWSIKNNLDQYTVMKNILFGLLHDIGKLECVRTYEVENKTMTGFPAHAEFGAMLLMGLTSESIYEYINSKDWFSLIESVLRHMSGYHGDEDDSNQYKRDLFLAESLAVKRFLSCNRVGDNFGKLPTNEVKNTDITHFYQQQKLFDEHIKVDIDTRSTFNLSDFLKKYKINHEKIIVYLIGTSGSGKSFLANKILSTHDATLVSRDCAIAQVSIGINKRLSHCDYKLMYEIYNTGKALYSVHRNMIKQKKKSDNNTEYKQALQAHVDAQNKWNTHVESHTHDEHFKYPKVKVWSNGDKIRDYSSEVRMTYCSYIMIALRDTNRILVMDTYMNSFPVAASPNIPQELSHYFRVHIHVQSYLKRDTSNVGGSVSEQLSISGQWGLDNLIHPDGIKKAKYLKEFASISSDTSTLGLVPKSTFSSNFKPHYVLHVARTQDGNFGYEHVLDTLGMFIHNIIPRVPTEDDSKINTGVDMHVNDIVGVDPETRDMDLVQFIRHIYKKYNGDHEQIREFLRTLGGTHACGFMYNPYIRENWDTMTYDEQRHHCLQLSKLSILWHRSRICKNYYLDGKFMRDPQLRSRYEFSLVTLKYFEQWGARFWQNKWAKEMRGTLVFINPDSTPDKVLIKVMAFKLPRGAEVMTGMHKSSGINETQDIKDKVTIFDKEQIHTCECLATKSPINLYLTSKGDGSLLAITLFSGSCINIIEPVISLFGDDLAIRIASQSMRITNSKYLMTFATQGTVMMGADMQSYMITSMLVGSNITTRDVLSKYEQDKSGMLSAWNTYGDLFIRKLLTFEVFDNLSESHTFSFEAICASRRGLFGDKIHTELACAYKDDRLIFLGMSVNEKRFYIPHPIYGKKFKIPFEEPLWWHIKDSDTVSSMMEAVEKMILDKMTKKEYLKLFPPSNSDFDVKNDSHIERAIIDFEGWVAMKVAHYDITDNDHLTVIKTLGILLTVYSKIKTVPYYKGHKFHQENIPYLIELAKTAGHIFPISRKVADMFAPGIITKRLQIVGDETMKLLDFKDNYEHFLLKALKTTYDKKLNEWKTKGSKGKMPKDPLVGFFKRPLFVQCKIALNNGVDFGAYLLPIYIKSFPELDADMQGINSILNGLTMHFEPWKPGYDKRIKDLDPASSAIQGLVLACMGQTIH